MKIYALSGHAEHGKNYTANIIQLIYEKEYGKRVRQLANGDYLKFLVRYIGWDGTKSPEMRQLLQQFGTEYVRNTIDENFWVDEIVKQIILFEPYFDVFILTDVRFPNEIIRLKESFGNENVVAVRVNRYNDDGSEYVSSLTEEQKNHPSETSLNDYEFDFYLRNFNDGQDGQVGNLQLSCDLIIHLIEVANNGEG